MSKPLRTYVSVELPPGFNEAYMEVAVEEKQASANLRKIHEQFFEVGHLCTSLYHRNAGDLAEMIPEILLHRILGIGGAILLNPPSKWASAVWDKEVPPPEFMDILEFQIFQGTDNCAKNLTKWMAPLQSVKSSSSF